MSSVLTGAGWHYSVLSVNLIKRRLTVHATQLRAKAFLNYCFDNTEHDETTADIFKSMIHVAREIWEKMSAGTKALKSSTKLNKKQGQKDIHQSQVMISSFEYTVMPAAKGMFLYLL